MYVLYVCVICVRRQRFNVEVKGLTINNVTCTLEKQVPSRTMIFITNTSTNTFRINKEVPLVDLPGVQSTAPLMKTIAPGKFPF